MKHFGHLTKVYLESEQVLARSTLNDIESDHVMREAQRADVIMHSRRAAALANGFTWLYYVVGLFNFSVGVVLLIALKHDRWFGLVLMAIAVVYTAAVLAVTTLATAIASYIRYRAEFDPIR